MKWNHADCQGPVPYRCLIILLTRQRAVGGANPSIPTPAFAVPRRRARSGLACPLSLRNVTQYENAPSADADRSDAKPYTTKECSASSMTSITRQSPYQRGQVSLCLYDRPRRYRDRLGQTDGRQQPLQPGGREGLEGAYDGGERQNHTRLPSYKESLKDYVAHFRNTPGYTGLFDSDTRTDPRKLAEAVQYGGFRQSDPLYAKKIMANVGHPLISRYGEEEG